MTVYVDDMRRPANLTGRPARWSHLMADTHDQLMQAALDLGLKPQWIQHEGTHREHFDVTETVRQRAIAAGVAEAISYPSGTGLLLARKREALKAAREAAVTHLDPPLGVALHAFADPSGVLFSTDLAQVDCDVCRAAVVDAVRLDQAARLSTTTPGEGAR